VLLALLARPRLYVLLHLPLLPVLPWVLGHQLGHPPAARCCLLHRQQSPGTLLLLLLLLQGTPPQATQRQVHSPPALELLLEQLLHQALY
jgi:hypothetical protein